jgi:hypothetical protein
MLRDLFTKGFAVTSLPKECADRMLEIVESQSFASVTGVYDQQPTVTETEFNFPEVWTHRGKAVQAFDLSDSPKELEQIWQGIGAKHLSPFQEIMGKFDQTCMLAHRFSVGQEIGFHSDTTEATFFGMIAYLGDTGFSEGDGGYLRLGRAHLDPNGALSNVTEIAKVMPNHGTLVIVSNIDPTFVHAVEPLRNKKKRFTQACRFGYSAQRFAIKKMNRGGYS